MDSLNIYSLKITCNVYKNCQLRCDKSVILLLHNWYFKTVNIGLKHLLKTTNFCLIFFTPTILVLIETIICKVLFSLKRDDSKYLWHNNIEFSLLEVQTDWCFYTYMTHSSLVECNDFSFHIIMYLNILLIYLD